MKKIISLAVALAMILSAVPFAFAQGETEPVLSFDGKTAKAQNAPDGAVLAVAQYGADGEQLEVKTAPAQNAAAEIAVEKAEGAAELKVMLWNSLKDMVPLVPALTVKGDEIGLKKFVAFDAANISTDNHGDIPLANYDWNSSDSGVCFSSQWSTTGTWNENFGAAGLMFFRTGKRGNGSDENIAASMNFASATAGAEKITIEYNFAMQDVANNYQTWYFKDIDGNTFATVYYDKNVMACVGAAGYDGIKYAADKTAVYALRGTPMKIEAVKGAEDWTITYTSNGTVVGSEKVPSVNGFASVGANIGRWNDQYAAMALQGLKVTVFAPEVADVTVKTVLSDGTEVPDKTVPAVAGSTVTYTNKESNLEIDGAYYTFNEEQSVTSVTAGGDNTITLVYDKFEGTGLTGDVITEEGATCWFADPRSLTVKNEADGVNTTYVGYIDVHGSVKAAQYDNNTGKMEEVLVRSNFQPDDHNNPTFLELPDHRIMIFYSRHTDEPCFYYRVSKVPYDITTFGEEKYLATLNNTTYPSPFILSDDPEHIYLCWRGINWHPTLGKLTIPDENGNVTLELEKQIVQSTGARPYAKYTSNGKDEIWVTYTTGHPDNEDPNWLYFNKININTLDVMDVNGNVLSNVNNGPLAVNKTTDASRAFAVSAPSGGTRNWVWELVNDNGTPVIAQVKIDGGKTNHNYYCTTYTDGKWQETFLTYAGGKFHPSNTEFCYSGGMTIDKANPHVFYCSVPVEGVFGKVFEIVKYTMNDDFTAVESTEYITKDSKEGNVRPYIANGSAEGDLRLTWMNGYYQYWMVKNSFPDGFPTRMMTNFDIPEQPVVNTLGEGNGELIAVDGNTEIKAAPAGKSFTISMDILQSDISVGGTLLKSGNLEIALEKSTIDPKKDYAAVAPKLTAGDKTQKSDNLFSNSDWFTSVSGTNGDKGVNSMGWINYTVTYDGSEVVTYVNGLIDATLQDVDVTLGETMELGGIKGIIANLRTADTALTQAEVRASAINMNVETDVTVETIVGGNVESSDTVKAVSGDSYSVAVDTIKHVGEELYMLNKEKSVTSIVVVAGAENKVTLVYDKMNFSENNLITNGDFTNGCTDWTNAADGGVFDGTISDNAEYIHGDGKALTNKTSAGGNTASTVRRFVPVEAGKTYYLSFYAYNTGDAITKNGAMSGFVPVSGKAFGTFNGVNFKDYVACGGQNSWSEEPQSDVKRGRVDMHYEKGMNHKEYIITVPEGADSLMISMFAWTAPGNLYFSDFVLREVVTE